MMKAGANKNHVLIITPDLATPPRSGYGLSHARKTETTAKIPGQKIRHKADMLESGK